MFRGRDKPEMEFEALGAALAVIGLYGLLACSVGRRTREIGIRMGCGLTSWMKTRRPTLDFHFHQDLL